MSSAGSSRGIRQTHHNSYGGTRASGGSKGVYALNAGERQWVAHQPYLAKKGYILRPRYNPKWVPSWKSNGRHPPDCEDSWELPAIDTLDALTGGSRPIHVSLKMLIPTARYGRQEIHNQLEMLRYLAHPELRQRPGNPAPRLIDSFPVPGHQDGIFIVTPFLYEWKTIPFTEFSELMDLIQQLLQGIQFLHSCNIFQGNASIVMMDASPLYGGAGFPHPCDPYTSLDGRYRLAVGTRARAPVRYYFGDFGDSIRFPSSDRRHLVSGVHGREGRAPELRTPARPYDGFKLDIFTIGMFINDNILLRYKGFKGLVPLIQRMTEVDPLARPDSTQCVDAYFRWANQCSSILKRWDLRSPCPPLCC